MRFAQAMKMSSLFMLRTRHKYLLCFLALAISSSYFDASVLAHEHNHQDLKKVKVGFVANLNERWGTMAHHFVEMAITDFYKKHDNYKTRLSLQVRRCPNNDVITSAAIVEDLIKYEQVTAIIGPETSQEAQFGIKLGERFQVPIISYSASSPMLSSPYFIQATQNDSSQVQAISSIIQSFGWREVTPVYVNNEFGGGIIPFLIDALQQINTLIPYRSIISSSATDDEIKHELSKLKQMQTRVFVVHMNETLASRVFFQARNLEMMTSGYAWIITSNIANTLGYLDHDLLRESMQGVLGVRTHVPRSKAVEAHAHDLKLSNLQMSLYGLWAYDATFLLAKAVEQVHESNFTFVPEAKNSSSSNSSLSSSSLSLLTSPVSNVGPNLTRELLKTSFLGLSGNFRLDVNGKLQSSSFEIINVVGSGEKRIGFWTPEKGLDWASPKSKSIIIWPGDTNVMPKGWAIPAKDKPLKVGIPIKPGFTEFVKASSDSSTQPTGFCIDLFEAVRKILPYDLPVNYAPTSDSYDDLISKVHSKEYDAVVGDVTIIANRSLFVDFALPYIESDVLMVVPAVKDSDGNKAWAFLRPLSWQLWVTSLCFFILIAFVVWLNEYQINDEFRADSWKGQVGLCLFYSFSTMVFSHKEVPKSNLSRFVMVFWVFTLLLITQSYTASLSSMLTVEKLKPAYKDVNQLLRSGKKIGYQNGTFVKEYLRKMKFDESKMLSYDTSEQLHDLLSKGSEGGGVDAAFDEGPYIKLFLSRHCSKYMTVVPPMPRTDGFAFVFPQGSPLVADISRAVLNITEGEIMSNLTQTWLNKLKDCPIDPSASPETSSSTLDLGSFAALFAITGGTCLVAIILKFSFFIYENRKALQGNGSMSLKKRLTELNKSFHTKKGSMCRVSPEADSSRGSTPPRNSVSDVIDDAGMTLPISTNPPRR